MKPSNFQTIKLSNFLLAAALTVFSAQNVFAADITVQVAPGQGAFGKASGGKANAKAGTTLTFKATPAKGYGFIGWYEGTTRVSWRSNWKYTVTDVDKVFSARFQKSEFGGLYVNNYKPNGYTLGIDVTPNAADCFSATYPNDTNPSEMTLTVSGLPPGIKASADPDPMKNGSVVLIGSTQKAGVYYVTVSAKDSCGFTHSIVQKWIVGGADPKDGDFDEGCMPNDSDLAMQTGEAYWWGRLEDAKKLTASGIPAGLKFTSYLDPVSGKLCSDLKGYPSKPGKYVISMALTCNDGTVKKGRKTIIVKDSGSYYVTVDVGSSSEGLGKVSGSGIYKVGSKVPLSAKPASKDYVFAGWFTDKACTKPLVSSDNRTGLGDCFTASGEYRKASDSMTFYYEAISRASTIYAKFLPKVSDYISLSTDLGGKDKWETGPMSVNAKNYIGYSVDSGTLPTVTAKGLPPGFKLDTKNSWIEVEYSKVKPGMEYENVQLIAKNQTGKTDVKTFTICTGNYTSSLVPDLKADTDVYEAMVGEIMDDGKWNEDMIAFFDSYGDWKVSVSGLPPGVKASYDFKGFYLTGIASKAGIYTPIATFTRGSGATKQTEKFSFTISVYEQNQALIGTFNGVTCHDADGNDIRPQTAELVTITSAKGGKLSAKVGKNSLSGNGWRYYDKYSCYVAELFAHTKEDGHNIQYMLYVEADPVLKEPGSTKNITGRLERTDTSIGETLECYFFAKQNWFGHKYWPDDRAAELAARKTMYFKFDGVIYFNTWNSLVDVTDTKAPVKVTVDKKGVMKLSAAPDGKAHSGSTTLLPEADGSLTGYLPISIKSSCGEGRWLFRFTYKNGTVHLEVKYDGGGTCG